MTNLYGSVARFSDGEKRYGKVSPPTPAVALVSGPRIRRWRYGSL